MEILSWPRCQFPSVTSPIHDRRRSKVVAHGMPRRRRSENVEGEFFVDERCIDCDTCRWMAPETFERIGDMSAVYRQPSQKEERFRALQALIACPTASIHTEKAPAEIQLVHESFPLAIDEHDLPDVLLCGYHSQITYGATSYLIIHPQGNIFVDSPRYNKSLARRIQMLGGARYMFLTHKDDVGDHHMWREEFGLERILHSADLESSTADVETKLFGEGPWSLGADIDLIHTPGHTQGSVCLLYKPLKALFTGDHLAISKDFQLIMFEQYSRNSVKQQLSSIQKLMALDFLWVLPGHERRVRYKDTKERDSALNAFVARKEIQYANSARA